MEALKHALQVLRRNAGTGIADFEHDVARQHATGYLDMCTGWGVLVRVGQHIHDGLFQPLRIGFSEQRLGQVNMQRLVLRVNEGHYR